MHKVIASNIINSFPEANSIIEFLISNSDEYNLDDNSFIYFGFPKFIGYEEESLEPDLLLLSPKHGILVIRFSKVVLSEKEVEDNTEELYSLLFSKLNESRLLRQGRGNIKINLETYIYMPSNNKNIDYVVTCVDDIINKLKNQLCDKLSNEILNETKSIIEGTKALTSINTRNIDEEDRTSKAFIVSELENEIKTFDLNQLQSAITIIDGPQRIRGLAGSGKTVVLAMKAAQIHLNEPKKKILFTFYTKSLYQQIKNLITKFYRHYKKIDPNWDYIHIKHAWGGQGIDGVYYSTCIENGIRTINFTEAKQNSDNPFNYICKKVVETKKIIEKYDYTLIDEAQDLPTYFFRMIYNLTKYNPKTENEKNIVWGYDDLQNIFNVKTKTAKDLFGSDSEGLDFIDLERASRSLPSYLSNDIVLKKCYRNPRSILLVAHSLGFGFYNIEKELPVQVLENKDHWEDLGYKVLTGELKDNEEVIIERPEENSPLSINRYVDEKDLINLYNAENVDDEVLWISEQIKEVIYKEFLNPEDILIISLDDRNAKYYFRRITEVLVENEIEVNNILLNPYTSTDFVNKGKITLSTVHRAKGNEAPVVFVVGIDAIHPQRKTRSGRNKLFTAFTRTKCCLKVSGIGKEAKYFFDEISETLNTFPTLKFIQPSKEEVERIQRDLNDKDKKMKVLLNDFIEKLKEEGFSDLEIDEKLKTFNKI